MLSSTIPILLQRQEPAPAGACTPIHRETELDAEIVHTERPRHATELARRAVDEGCELVVAIGGDGTMNETAAA
ncbi:MAG: acylglycerol kinase family protein [Nibricoccus sp.]